MADKNDPYAHLPDAVHPFKNFVPRANPPKAESQLQPETAAPFPLNPDKLAKLSKEELIALIKRCAGYSWGVGMMTKAEISEAIKHRLAVEALDRSSVRWESAGREYLDRSEGKSVTPVAAVMAVVEEKPVDIKQLARKIQFLMSMPEVKDSMGLLENGESGKRAES